MTRLSQCIIFSIVIGTAYCQCARAINLNEKVPPEAEIAVQFLQSVADGNGLSAIDRFFDFNILLKRTYGNDYDKLSDEEKAYGVQLLAVFTKSIYRQKFMAESIRQSRFFDVTVKKENAFYTVSMKREYMNDVSGFGLYVFDNGKEKSIGDIYLEDTLISVRLHDGYKHTVEDAPDNLKEAAANLKFIDYLEVMIVRNSENLHKLNESMNEEK